MKNSLQELPKKKTRCVQHENSNKYYQEQRRNRWREIACVCVCVCELEKLKRQPMTKQRAQEKDIFKNEEKATNIEKERETKNLYKLKFLPKSVQ